MIRELLKPPFYRNKSFLCDSNNEYLFCLTYNEKLGSLTEDEWENFASFLLSALNEKWERDFGGKDTPKYQCGDCNKKDKFAVQEFQLYQDYSIQCINGNELEVPNE